MRTCNKVKQLGEYFSWLSCPPLDMDILLGFGGNLKKFKKISNPSLGSFLSSEPNFTLRK
jgi:hypothetical protein